MPILLKDFTWSQSKSHIYIRLPINGANTKQFNIFTHEDYVKIHSEQNFFEAFLLHKVIEQQSYCKTLENEVRIILCKKIEIEWDYLEKTCSKEEKIKTKCLILDRAHALVAKEKEIEKTDKYNLKQNEIQKEITRESSIRKEIESICKEECSQTTKSINRQSSVETPRKQNDTCFNRLNKEGKLVGKEEIKPKATTININIQQHIRIPGNIQVKFSNRIFPTPQRESQEFAEQEWLIKQHEARKTIGILFLYSS